jgi:hypothetical protein
MISVKIGFASKEKDKNGVQKCQAFILNQVSIYLGHEFCSGTIMFLGSHFSNFLNNVDQ